MSSTPAAFFIGRGHQALSSTIYPHEGLILMQDTIWWHEDVCPLADVKSWILVAVHGASHVEEPVRKLSPKHWGQIAEFKVDGEAVIFKGCELPLFSRRTETEVLLSHCCPKHVPTLLACKVLPDQQTWTLHRAFNGTHVRHTKRFENILEMTRTLAQIQTKVAQQPRAETSTLPQFPVEKIPQTLDFMIERIVNEYASSWLDNANQFLNEFGLPLNALEKLEYFRPQIAKWTQQYIDGAWPISIDHVDFSVSNAAVQEDGRPIIFDWEEAVLSSPFFSIERLLCDADAFEDDPKSIPQTAGNLLLTPNQMAIRNGYIDAIPWYTRPQREQAFDLAMCLAPIKTAYARLQLNEMLDWRNLNPVVAANCFGRALHFWNAMEKITFP